ncbi:MAG: hypothetical protein ACU0A5_14675 [Salipiger marinus]|uniref:hypothetical protein n=1 Tax=Salipiger marinus TaxID=555512 RepID=UPI004058A20A
MRALIVFALAFAAACSRDEHSAVVSFYPETEVAMSVRGMWSLQSDWHRSLLLSGPEGSEEIELPDDTGWWRGSNLYFHKSGIYVLHEGQGGCIYFSISPPAFLADSSISCEKSSGLVQPKPDVVPGVGLDASRSRFYKDLFYLGRFAESFQDGPRIAFIDAAEQQESELPDPM